MDTTTALDIAEAHLKEFAATGHSFNLISIGKPGSHQVAVDTAKIISKLSPILGNMIEFSFAEVLNRISDLQRFGQWKRQDPGFPDTILDGTISPIPGFEIKAWFPLATEITARFKDSQLHFAGDNTRVALLAWLPEHVIYGKPKLIDVCVVSGKSIAEARDRHYHNPPDYLVLEPGDTTARSRNLQQTNTNGYKLQSRERFAEAQRIVNSWPSKDYSSLPEYQLRLQNLLGRFTYRLDTNYAKIDRINHPDIEAFKKKVEALHFCGMTVNEWSRTLASGDVESISTALRNHLNI